MIGNVYNADTYAPLTGATVSNDSGESTTTETTPDPAVDDSFYTLFSPASSHTFTATMSGGYSYDTTAVTVVQSDTVRQDFYLLTASLSHDPQALQASLLLNASLTTPFTLTNSGLAALEFEISEVEDGFVPAAGSLVINVPLAKPVAVGEAALHQAEGQEFIRDNRYTIEHQHLLASSVDVLLVHADSDLTQFKAFLEGYPDIDRVDTWDASSSGSIPGLSDLLAYNVVIAWNNLPWADPDLIGDVLADYHDAGGNVILTVDAWSADTYRTGGRFIDEEYTPFLSLGGAVFNDVTLGWYDASHPLMDGISTSAAHFHNQVELSTAAVLVAEWDDGMPFVAIKTKNGHKAVGINTYYGNGDISWTTDAPLIVHNAIVNLLTKDIPWLSEDPITDTVPAHSAKPITITFDAAQVAQPGVYRARLRVSSNDLYSPTVGW